jgi:hypothetical protein
VPKPKQVRIDIGSRTIMGIDGKVHKTGDMVPENVADKLHQRYQDLQPAPEEPETSLEAIEEEEPDLNEDQQARILDLVQRNNRESLVAMLADLGGVAGTLNKREIAEEIVRRESPDSEPE